MASFKSPDRDPEVEAARLKRQFQVVSRRIERRSRFHEVMGIVRARRPATGWLSASDSNFDAHHDGRLILSHLVLGEHSPNGTDIAPASQQISPEGRDRPPCAMPKSRLGDAAHS
jgi:hypothetical protein